MGLGWRFWEYAADCPLAETEAMELVLADLSEGASLQEAFERTSRAMRAIGVGDSAAAAMAVRLEAWAPLCRRDESRALAEDSAASEQAMPAVTVIAEPWQSLVECWQALGDSQSIAGQAEGLVRYLRARRMLAVEAVMLWATMAPTLAILAAGCVTIAAAEGACGQFMLARISASGRLLPPQFESSIGLPLIWVGAGLFLSWILHRYLNGRLVPRLAGGRDAALLFFLGSSVEAGWPLPRGLRGAARMAGSSPGESLFLLRTAHALERSTPLPPPGEADSARRVVVHMAALARQQALDGAAIAMASAGLAERRLGRRGRMAVWGMGVVMLPAVLFVMPALLALLGGPTGDFWERRVDSIFRTVEALHAARGAGQ